MDNIEVEFLLRSETYVTDLNSENIPSQLEKIVDTEIKKVKNICKNLSGNPLI